MKKLLLILLCLPVIGFGQDYKEPKDKYGFAINSVIGWSNSGLFAYRNVSSDVSVVTDSISVINFSDNQEIDLLSFEGETWANNENVVNDFLSKYNIQQINPILFNIEDIKHNLCVKELLSLETLEYELLGYYKSPFDKKKIVINIGKWIEESGGIGGYSNVNHIYINEYYECILE